MKKDILAVRLGIREKRLLDETQKRLGVSRSSVVREAIVRYAAQTKNESEMTVAERWAPWIGKFKGADPNLSRNVGARLRKILLDKHARRPR